MSLSEYIKKYREEHDNMSYRAFAALVGMSPQYVINLENGTNNDGKTLSPTMNTYKKIARGTGLSEAELFAIVDDSITVNPELTDDQKELMDILRNLPPEQTGLVLSLARKLSGLDKSQDEQG